MTGAAFFPEKKQISEQHRVFLIIYCRYERIENNDIRKELRRSNIY